MSEEFTDEHTEVQSMEAMNEKFRVNKNLTQYTEEELRYLQTPEGSAAFTDYESESLSSISDSSDYEEESEKEEDNYYYEPECAETDVETDLESDLDTTGVSFSGVDTDWSEQERRSKKNIKVISPTEESFKKSTEIYNHPDVPLPKTRMECQICGSIISKSYYSMHRKTKKHQSYMKMNERLRKVLLR